VEKVSLPKKKKAEQKLFLNFLNLPLYFGILGTVTIMKEVI